MSYREAPVRWDLPTAKPLTGYPRVLGQILANRGADPKQAAALVGHPADHHDPFELHGMEDAVTTLTKAIAEKRRIAIYGDFDCDGITATAVLVRALRTIGVDAMPYIPNRMSEGYGLHGAALEQLAKQGVGCVVSVDCGTSSVDDAAVARRVGMLLAVTDHHLPLRKNGAETLVDADALVNPKQLTDEYPFEGLSGAGVAFKLVEALESRGIVPKGTTKSVVGLAALGTIADVMPLVDENRTIVRVGIDQLRNRPFPGIAALCDQMKVRPMMAAQELAFTAIPAINASGRMEDAKLSLDLCLCDDPVQAQTLAAQLIEQNQARKAALEVAMVEAERQVARLSDKTAAIVIGSADWPMGIVGLVAGRIAEKYQRPTLALSLVEPEAKGSARSNSGVHIFEAIEQAAKSGTILRYGGHAMAAGFSIDAKRFRQFKTAVQRAVQLQLSSAPRERVLPIDCVLEGRDVTPALMFQHDRLEPYGMGNREPLFALLNAQVIGTKAIGDSGKHWRVRMRGTDGGVFEVVAWSRPGLDTELWSDDGNGNRVGKRIDVCCTVEQDSWIGRDGTRNEQLRLRLREMRDAVEITKPAVRRSMGTPGLAA